MPNPRAQFRVILETILYVSNFNIISLHDLESLQLIFVFLLLLLMLASSLNHTEVAPGYLGTCKCMQAVS